MSTAREIRAAALARLAEISDHGCEAASARAFEEGRLAALDALELGAGTPTPRGSVNRSSGERG